MTRARKPARNPAPRTIALTIAEGDFAGWECTALVSFPAAWILDLQSGDFARILAVLDRIITEHNFPNADGELAERMADVDYEGLRAVAETFTEALGRLPPR